MKRHIIAIVLGSFVALPVLANNEIDAGNVPLPVASTKSRAQVYHELIAAQRAGHTIVNAELGTLAKPPVPMAGKTREQVRSELVAAQRAGDTIVNAELGWTARQMDPARYAGATRMEARSVIASAAR